MKKLTSIFFFQLLAVFALAQSENDVLRYSFTTPIGTARTTAMGGAFGAVGADLFSPVINPAGVGVYRKSEFVFSPGLYAPKTNSSYYGTTNTDDRFKLNIANWGFVFNSKLGKDDNLEEWKSISFAYTYNRVNDFSQRVFIQGQTQNKSIIDGFLAGSNGISPENLDQFSNYLAFDTYLIDTFYVLGTNNYIGQVYNDPKIRQTKSINRNGAQGESAFTVSGNYANRWYVGGSVGFKRVNFSESAQYSEKILDTIQLQEIIYNNDLSTNGGGFFAKIGTIFVPAPWLRLGLSLHSGTRLNLTDAYSSNITAKYNNGSLTSESPQGGFDYTIRTPGKINVSMVLLNSKIGMLSADYEISDFRNSRLIPNSTFADINQNISNAFALNQTIRVGGEIRLTPNYLIRLGYSNSSSPYKNNLNSFAFNRYTGGVGYREDWFFVDLAFALTSFSENYYLYNPSFIDAANLKNIHKNFITTVGFRF
jgi:hypothetical protein